MKSPDHMTKHIPAKLSGTPHVNAKGAATSDSVPATMKVAAMVRQSGAASGYIIVTREAGNRGGAGAHT